jgi:hypothetical protein
MGYGNSEETVMAIGSGLYARTRTPLSLLEQYRRLQAGCTHRKRDPRGTCYGCGHHRESNVPAGLRLPSPGGAL